MDKVCVIGAGSSGIAACQVLDAQTMRKRDVASTRHTIQVDYYPYMHLLRKERKRGRGLSRSLPAAVERPASAARAG